MGAMHRGTACKSLLLISSLAFAANSEPPSRSDARAALETVLAHLEATFTQIEEGREKNLLLQSMASLQAKLGSTALAREITGEITERPFEEFALANISQAQADAGDLEAARKTALEIEDPYERGRALLSVAVNLANSGQVYPALAIAAEIEQPAARSEALSMLGLALGERGESAAADTAFAQATDAALELNEAEQTVWHLVSVAEMQKWAGFELPMRHTLDLARAIADQLEPGGVRNRLLAELAAAQAKLGLQGEAYVTSGALDEPQHQAKARGAIGAQEIEEGGSTTALAFIESLGEPTSQEEKDAQAEALGRIAIAFSNAQNYAAALDAVNRIPARHPERAHNLALIARSLWWVGREAEATQAFQGALDAAEEVESPPMRDQALRIVAHHLGHSEKTEEALLVLLRIHGGDERRNAYWDIAQAQGRRAEAAGALEWVLPVEDAVDRAKALLGLAYGLVDYERYGPPEGRLHPRSIEDDN